MPNWPLLVSELREGGEAVDLLLSEAGLFGCLREPTGHDRADVEFGQFRRPPDGGRFCCAYLHIRL